MTPHQDQSFQYGDLVVVLNYGPRKLATVRSFRPAAYEVVIHDSIQEFEAVVEASQVVATKGDEILAALKARLADPARYVPKPKIAPPKAAPPPEEPIERVVPETIVQKGEDGLQYRVNLLDVTQARGIDRQTRELLQTLIDLTHVCGRATFRPADQPVVDHATKVLSRQLEHIFAGGGT